MTQERERDRSGARRRVRPLAPPTRRSAAPTAGSQAIAPTDGRRARLTHVERIPARSAREVDWPSWADPAVVAAFAGQGIDRPWSHQAEVAEHVRAGRHAVVATGTASGKSLGYLLPVLTGVLEGAASTDPRTPAAAPPRSTWRPRRRSPPTSCGRCARWTCPACASRPYDGDTGAEDRDWVRRHGRLRADQPRHAAPVDAARAPAVGGLLARAVATSWSTRCTPTGGCSASHVVVRAAPGAPGGRGGTAPSRSSCSRRPRCPSRVRPRAGSSGPPSRR